MHQNLFGQLLGEALFRSCQHSFHYSDVYMIQYDSLTFVNPYPDNDTLNLRYEKVGDLNGAWVSYIEGTNVMDGIGWRDSLCINGTYVRFYPNGKPFSIVTSRNGNVVHEIVYCENGNIDRECHFTDIDAKKVECLTFYSIGSVFIKEIIVDGHYIEEIVYTKKGRWLQTTYFRNGRYHKVKRHPFRKWK
jgi:antitoxin component YwqK of YwqJK toxin-antitoxin module